jgi:hypothetical protein
LIICTFVLKIVFLHSFLHLAEPNGLSPTPISSSILNNNVILLNNLSSKCRIYEFFVFFLNFCLRTLIDKLWKLRVILKISVRKCLEYFSLCFLVSKILLLVLFFSSFLLLHVFFYLFNQCSFSSLGNTLVTHCVNPRL